MIIEALINLPESSRQTVLYNPDRSIEIANNIALEEYFRTLDRVTGGTTVVVFSRHSLRGLGSVFGSGQIEPTEVITDGTITETAHFGINLEIPNASYTGWTAGRRWDKAPYDYFINTHLGPDKVRTIARLARATQLTLAINRGSSEWGVKLTKPRTYPFTS